MCDGAVMSNNRYKVDKSHSDDCDSGSTDTLTLDSRANGKLLSLRMRNVALTKKFLRLLPLQNPIDRGNNHDEKKLDV